MDIEVIKAAYTDKSVLRNMMELYLYDFSEYDGADLNQHGLYEYEYIDQYWTEPVRYPYFLRVNGSLAGFALIRTIEPADEEAYYSMAEFFVMKKYRRQYIGKTFANRLFDMHPGKWRVAQEENNHPSQVFWRKVISDYTNSIYKEIRQEGWEGPIQEFNNSSKEP
jgi:predicted acetyltransferase